MNTNRLIITKIILENFKSYAGKVTIGPFHSSFSAVVGPNGSGKSNLLECLLFAFGKRAKKMRLNKISELIHKSVEHSDLSYAKVEVHFENIIENEGNFSKVSNSDFCISRIVYKNNTSNYSINRQPASYENVVSLLKSKSIDLEQNRFLILQGEVESIALMKPKAVDDGKIGLLEYLEEIIGSDVYVERICQIEKELEDLAETIVSRKMQVEEANKSVESLTQPVKLALEYLEYHKKIYQYKNLKYQIYLHRTYKDSAKISEELLNNDKSIENLRQESYSLYQKHSNIKTKIDEKNNKLKTIEKSHAIIKAQLKKYLESINIANREIEGIENLITENDKEKKIEQKKISEATKKISDMESLLPELNSKYNEAKIERECIGKVFKEVHEGVLEKTEHLHKEKKIAEKNINPLKTQLSRIKPELDNNKKNLNQWEKDLESIKKNIETYENEMAGLMKEINEKDKNYLLKSDIILATETKIKNLEVELEDYNIKIDEYTKIIRDYKRMLNDIEKDEKSTEGQSKTLKEILNAKYKGNLKGIIGRLGDLAAIDPLYDIAISSASQHFDDIVVENIQSGNELLKYAREKSLGKIRILVLDKMTSNINISKNIDPKAQRLYDLLDIQDQKYSKAFYFALKDTLVVENLEDCKKIAYSDKGRHRVVCITGEVFQPSGEMLGFSRPISGKIKLKDKKLCFGVDRKKIEDEARKFVEEHSQYDLKKKKVEGEIVIEKERLKKMKCEIVCLKSEIEEKRARDESFKFKIKSLEERKKEISEEELKKIRISVRENEKAIQDLEKIIEDKTLEIIKIEQKIDDIGGESYKELKTKLYHQTSSEESIEQTIMKAESKKTQSIKDLEKSADKLAKLEEDRIVLLAKLQSNQINCIDLSNQFQEKNHELELTSKEIDTIKQDIETISKHNEDVNELFGSIEKRKLILEEKNLDLKSQAEILMKYNKKITEKIIKNRESYKIQNFHILDDEIFKIDHETKKLKNEVHLIQDVFFEFPSDVLEANCCALKIIKNASKELEGFITEALPNFAVLQEYEKKKLEKNNKDKLLYDIKDVERRKKSEYIELKTKRLTEFKRGFFEVSENLKKIYREITCGGDAELEFADTTDPFSEGIVFTVRPPNKSWKKMTNLSGGEKTLSSLSLVFALHSYKPNVLYVMDEVDAALDFQNVGTIAAFIKAKTKNAQFIVVSLRYQMFELADQLIGIYKVEDKSKTIAVTPRVLENINSDNQIVQQTVRNLRSA
ncbi:hypothetical protein SteCoe_14079 [Stentor coeruleus]|uniref:Structural maintenance of chromosomes protein n=1 Tax=Stentor coeruleus TaxID=5963 RepID=A0A1R2C6X7_9CILI|nr:hypothetical protein SteCoe_14079 [Stentor coeruleus]